MAKNVIRPMTLAGAAGLALAAAASAQQPYVINLSGATLLQNQLIAPALTNDFIDVNGNGVSGQNSGPQSTRLDQLAPGVTTLNNTAPPARSNSTAIPNNSPSRIWWFVSYRATGSVNGVQELNDFASPVPFVTTPADAAYDPSGILFSRSTRSVINRVEFINSNVVGLCNNAVFNGQNPAALPIRSTTPAAGTAPEATWAGPTSGCGQGPNPIPANGLGATVAGGGAGAAAPGGTRIDIAPVDVPTLWAIRGPVGSPTPAATPGTLGYGRNPRVSVSRAGTSTGVGAGIDNQLANLTGRQLFDPANPGAATNTTVFDTSIAFAPIAAMVNQGVGKTETSQSELRFLYATGRLPSGENLVAATRDSGSGTRNGFISTVGLDASWGVGDNVGGSPISGSNDPNEDRLGSTFVPGNKAGSGNLERTVVNHRLGVGYSGAERAGIGSAPASWGTSGRAEAMAVRCDLTVGAGAVAVRPTAGNVLDASPTNPNSYAVGGPAIFATIGDPRNENEIGGTPGNTNPRMSNPQAAAFLNNITRSIDNFVTSPTGTATNDFMPGELIAQQQILTAGLDAPHSSTNPLVLVPGSPSSALQDYIRSNWAIAANNFYAAGYGSVSFNGVVPDRRTGVNYTDNNGVASNVYVLQNGTTVSYGGPLPTRNRIAGDFDGNGLRNLNDAVELVRAWYSRNSGPTWNAPSYTGPNATGSTGGGFASIEILGDFNGDGNFTREDVRYWADGLAIDPATGRLDRKKGFEAIDNAWLQVQADAGVANPSNNFFNTTIQGASGTLPYVVGASRFDVTGSGGIARGWAPVGANGVVNADDQAYIAAQITASGGNGNWVVANFANAANFDLSADVTGDLVVDAQDLNAAASILGGGAPSTCYANCDGSTSVPVLNAIDFSCFLNRYRAGDAYANCDGSTSVPQLNAIDFSCFLTRYRAPEAGTNCTN